MVDDDFPDFWLRHAGGSEKLPFEVVEADHETRRRGEEYRRARALDRFDPGEEAAAAPLEIRRVVSNKAMKGYRPRPHLLVHVNLLTFGQVPCSAAELAEIVRSSAAAFASIWLLWAGRVIRVAPTMKMFTAARDPFGP